MSPATRKPATSPPTPDAQLKAFIAGLTPKTAKLFRAIRAALRKKFPTANELAYNYSHSVVISYSATEGGIDGIVALASRDDGVRLYLTQGKALKDPAKLLKGSGNARYVVVEGAADLSKPDLKALVAAAVAKSKKPYPAKGKGKLIIRTGGRK